MEHDWNTLEELLTILQSTHRIPLKYQWNDLPALLQDPFNTHPTFKTFLKLLEIAMQLNLNNF